MYALKNRLMGKRREAEDRVISGPAEFVVVLPRVLRRPALFISALVEGRVAIPGHTGTLAAVSLFALTGLYGVVQGGHLRALAEETTSIAGFAIERVDVAGNIETSPIDVVQQLGLDGHTSLITLDLVEARKMIMALPWVASADIRKIYPDVIDVSLSERRAYGIWQHGQELSLIDVSGNVIAPMIDGKFAQLPLFVGLGADVNADAFNVALDAWPELKSRITAYIRVADRRWDIRLGNGITIRLPENNAEAAIAKLRRLEAEQGLLERDIETVDLRLDDRITIGLTDNAVVRRDAAIKEREQMLKKRGRNS